MTNRHPARNLFNNFFSFSYYFSYGYFCCKQLHTDFLKPDRAGFAG